MQCIHHLARDRARGGLCSQRVRAGRGKGEGGCQQALRSQGGCCFAAAGLLPTALPASRPAGAASGRLRLHVQGAIQTAPCAGGPAARAPHKSNHWLQRCARAAAALGAAASAARSRAAPGPVACTRGVEARGPTSSTLPSRRSSVELIHASSSDLPAMLARHRATRRSCGFKRSSLALFRRHTRPGATRWRSGREQLSAPLFDGRGQVGRAGLPCAASQARLTNHDCTGGRRQRHKLHSRSAAALRRLCCAAAGTERVTGHRAGRSSAALDSMCSSAAAYLADPW